MTIEIIENYGDWAPPKYVRGMVEALVKSVPEKHLVGLESIILTTTTTASNRSFRRKKVKHRGRMRSKVEANGSYQAYVSTSGPLFRERHQAEMTLFIAILTFALAGGPGRVMPDFSRAVALDNKADITANASLGDLNGDGYPDIVLAKGRHWPLVDLVLLNDGQGHFNRRYSVSDRADRSYTAALGDLNGDGTLDLVVGNDAPDEKVIYFNNGKGNFTFAGTFGDPRWPTRNVTVVDLNGDGRLDIVVANRREDQPGANYVCLNDGRGNFATTCRTFSTESATTIAAGDLNGDGFPDLVVPHREGGQSYIYINDGHGAFAEKRPFGPANCETRAIALADLNGDRKLDIIIGDQARGGAFIYFNQGRMEFSSAVQIVGKEDTVYSVAVSDMNGDGRADVVLGNSEAPGVVLINDGTGRSFTRVRFGDAQGTVYGLALGDVNGDGSPDIIAARSDAPSMLYLNSLVMKVRGN